MSNEDFNPNEPSKGLGDSIAKITHALGIDKVADGAAKLLGAKDCGCNNRRKFFNDLFPYKDGVKLDIPSNPAPSLPSPTPRPLDKQDYEFTGTKKFLIHKEFSVHDSNRNMEFKYIPGDVVDIGDTDPVYPNLMKLLQTQYISVFE